MSASAGDVLNSSAFLDASQICYKGIFDTQVDKLLHHVRLTEPELDRLQVLFDDLTLALQPLAPGLQILPFGSIVTGLGIKSSDVDCYIILPDDMQPNTGLIIQARDILAEDSAKFTNLSAIVSAKVPIVKFLHIPTNYNCDFNFQSCDGVQNSRLIGQLLQMDSSDKVLKLAIIVKYWSKVHRITGTNLLTSYSLSLMVIFYLQGKKILPSIKQLQDDEAPYMIDNWNNAICENTDKYTKDSDESLYDLLTGFFIFYGSFDFEDTIISPYLGSILNRSTFEKVEDVPPAFELYVQNALSNACKQLRINTFMCVQDPFDHSRNLTASVHVKLGMKMRSHFQFCARMAHEFPPEDFLYAILMEDLTCNEPTVNAGPTPKQIQQNTVMKAKIELQQTKQQTNAIQNTLNIISCYQQIRNIKKHKK